MPEQNNIPWCDIVSKVAYQCWSFSLNLAFYQAARDATGERKYEETDHLLSTMNTNNLFSTVVSWCHFFGSRADAHHWRKILPEEKHEEFEAKLHEIAGSAQAWMNYRESIKIFRDQHVAHIDRVDGHVPEMEKAFQIIQALYEELKRTNSGCRQCWEFYPQDLVAEFEKEKHKASDRLEQLFALTQKTGESRL